MRMKNSPFYIIKLSFFAFFVAICSFVTFYNLSNVFTANYKKAKFIPTLNLGIDIKGGDQLIIAMDDDKFISEYSETLRQSVIETLGKKNLSSDNLSFKIENHKLITAGLTEEQSQVIVKNLININQIYDFDFKYVNSKSNAMEMMLWFKKNHLSQVKSEAIDRAMINLKNRIDGVGVKEISMQKYSDDKIIILVPFGMNLDSIKKTIQTTAKLTFHLIDRSNVFIGDKIFTLSDDKRIIKDIKNKEIGYIIKNIPDLTGEYIMDVKPSNDGIKNSILFKLNSQGAEIFGRLTRSNPGKLLAVALDDEVLMAPVINEPIYGGQGTITGNFSLQEVNELSVMLKSGSLPVKLNIIDEKNISNKFGLDMLSKSKYSLLLSILGVMLFMLLRYKKLGLIANIALFLNFIMTITIMSLFGFTLTIPGIAGLILMLGMAVDANVLIYEKMKELYKKYEIKTFKEIIKYGFDGALDAIIDSNLTTIIASIALLNFGGSFLKGFAITLIIGIASSMFTAINLTKFMIIISTKKNKYNNFKPF